MEGDLQEIFIFKNDFTLLINSNDNVRLINIWGFQIVFTVFLKTLTLTLPFSLTHTNTLNHAISHTHIPTHTLRL